MIIDAQGRKWKMRFRRYQQGWHWQARHESYGQEAGSFFATKALAEEHARQVIQGHDAIAVGAEFFRRLVLRCGAQCQLTAEDVEAIARAGQNKP